jgi:hypothetical protein
MKKILGLIFCVVFSINAFSQEHYYWYQGKKIPLELVENHKYLMINNPDDTVALKTRLNDAGVNFLSFVLAPIGITYLEGVQPKIYCFTIIEGQNLPDFSRDEAVYEAPCFLLNVPGSAPEVALSHAFYVKLKKAEDFELLNSMAQEKKIELLGKHTFPLLWYTLSCTKASFGNAMQMANYFHESNLFEVAEPEFFALGIDFPTNNNTLPESGLTVTSSDFQITVDTQGENIDHLEIFALDGRLIFSSAYRNVSRVNLKLPAQKGVAIFKIRLQSGKILSKKLILK